MKYDGDSLLCSRQNRTHGTWRGGGWEQAGWTGQLLGDIWIKTFLKWFWALARAHINFLHPFLKTSLIFLLSLLSLCPSPSIAAIPIPLHLTRALRSQLHLPFLQLLSWVCVMSNSQENDLYPFVYVCVCEGIRYFPPFLVLHVLNSTTQCSSFCMLTEGLLPEPFTSTGLNLLSNTKTHNGRPSCTTLYESSSVNTA